MFIDTTDLTGDWSVSSDVCIIGAGAAGITIAREFIGLPLKVTLVEAGGVEFDPATQSLYQGASDGQAYALGLNSSRLRFFGGTTNHWSGRCRPLDAIDFEKRAWIPWSGWPLTLEDLKPFYSRAEELCELATGPFDSQAYGAGAPSRSTLLSDSNRLKNIIFKWSPPTRFGARYRGDLEASDNVKVYLRANVLEVVSNPQASTVAGVRAQTLNSRTGVFRARYYVLACGGIENARLLLLSNSVQPSGLGNGKDLVGRFFQEHPGLANAGRIVLRQPRAVPALNRGVEVGGRWLKSELALSSNLQRAREISNVSLRLSVSLDPEMGRDAAKRIASSVRTMEMPDNLGQDAVRVLRDWEQVFALGYQALTGTSQSLIDVKRSVAEIRVDLSGEQTPNPESRVTLDEELDGLGLRRAKLTWKLTDMELYSMHTALMALATELGVQEAGRMQLLERLDSEGWSHLDIRGQAHHMGTTRMAESEADGVVDKTCRVHQLDNLFIAGSSVFPTSGYANPTLTIVALALRLAVHLKALLRK